MIRNKFITDNTNSKKILVYGQLPEPYHGSNIMTEFFLNAIKKIGLNVRLSKKIFSRDIAEVNRITLIKFFRLFPVYSRFFKNLLSYKPDLVVFFISASKIGLLAEVVMTSLAQLFNVPYVLYIHARGHLEIFSSGRFSRKLILKVFKPAIACIVLGDIFFEDISNFFSGRIFVLPNCIEERNYELKQIHDKTIRISYLSNLVESKGIFTLIKSIPYIIKDFKNVEFWIGGPWQDESLRESIFAFIGQNHLGKYIKFLGSVYGKEKRKLFSVSDIFVFPTHYPLEALSLVVLEAMQAGLPVVSTNVGALPEIIEDGKNGYIIPPKNPQILADRVETLIRDPDLRWQLGEESRRRFEKRHTFDAYVKNLEYIIRELLMKMEDEKT